jgi:ESCRT-II complex subunit VPS25
VLATREKQLAQWRELILKYRKLESTIFICCSDYYFSNSVPLHCTLKDTDLKIKTLVIHECPLWKNESIDRELNRDEIRVVMDDFVKR